MNAKRRFASDHLRARLGQLQLQLRALDGWPTEQPGPTGVVPTTRDTETPATDEVRDEVTASGDAAELVSLQAGSQHVLARRVESVSEHPLVASPDSRSVPMLEPRQEASGPTSSAELAGEVCETEWGSHWIVRQPLEQLWPASVRYLDGTGAPRQAGSGSDVPLSLRVELAAEWLRHQFPRGTLFLDLETCGLAGTCIFLAGLLHWHEGRWTLTQLWARHYGEEKALLQTLLQHLVDCPVIVTYNGRSFDWPQVQDRCILHRLPAPGEDSLWRWRQARSRGRRAAIQRPREELAGRSAESEPMSGSIGATRSVWTPEPGDWLHLDLLHVARRWWRGQVPNFRLQTLERIVCGRRRVDDVAGAAIPRAYHDYVRSGSLDQVPAILHHNALDLVTCLQLMLVLLKPSV